MLINMKDLLEVASKHTFAVGSFNVANSEFVKAVVQAAEEENSPAIVQIHPNEIDLVSDHFIAYVREQANASRVPIAIHLDHGGSMYDVTRAIRNGYTSVMMDASHLPLEENIKATKEATDIAHHVNVSVEGELGTLGASEYSSEGNQTESLYTKPEEAGRFVSETNVDTLAVAVGTAHGIYPKTIDQSIKVDILKEIHRNVQIPLVLHGGSNNKDEEIREAIQNGICKINLSTDMKQAFFNQMRTILKNNPNDYEPDVLMPEATAATKKIIKQKMNLFGSVKKASLY